MIKLHKINSVLKSKCESCEDFLKIEKMLENDYNISLFAYMRICLIPNEYLKYMFWATKHAQEEWHSFILENKTTKPKDLLDLRAYTPDNYRNCIFNLVEKNEDGEWQIQTNLRRGATRYIRCTKSYYFSKKWSSAKAEKGIDILLKPMRNYIEKCEKVILILQHNDTFKKVINMLLEMKIYFINNCQLPPKYPIDALDLRRSPSKDTDEKNRIEYLNDRYDVGKLLK